MNCLWSFFGFNNEVHEAEALKRSKRIKKAADNLDWKIVEQLHEATLKISNDCFEYKKLCVAVIAGVIALMVKFGEDDGLKYVFAVCALVSVGFWFCDATAYYYQRSLRHKMTEKINAIAKRNNVPPEPVIDKTNMRQAIFNRSMALYVVLISLTIFLWLWTSK